MTTIVWWELFTFRRVAHLQTKRITFNLIHIPQNMSPLELTKYRKRFAYRFTHVTIRFITLLVPPYYPLWILAYSQD